jgi:hypothetical protein
MAFFNLSRDHLGRGLVASPERASMSGNLARHLHHHSIDATQRLALSVAGVERSYGDLARLGRTIAGWLLGGGRAGRVGVLAGRSSPRPPARSTTSTAPPRQPSNACTSA